MITYANLGGDSNVKTYEIGVGSIVIEFGDNAFYKYTDGSAGSGVVTHMGNLAMQGRGLNSYVSTNKPPYESKW